MTEKEQILDLVDLNKDQQVSKLDVIKLNEILQTPKQINDFVERLDNADQNIKKLAIDSLGSSLKAFFEQKDFLQNIQNQENVYLIQFYAKIFFWVDIELNWEYSEEIKDIYDAIIYDLSSFEYPAFWDNYLNLLIKQNTYFDQKIVSREEFENIKPNILIDN